MTARHSLRERFPLAYSLALAALSGLIVAAVLGLAYVEEKRTSRLRDQIAAMNRDLTVLRGINDQLTKAVSEMSRLLPQAHAEGNAPVFRAYLAILQQVKLVSEQIEALEAKRSDMQRTLGGSSARLRFDPIGTAHAAEDEEAEADKGTRASSKQPIFKYVTVGLALLAFIIVGIILVVVGLKSQDKDLTARGVQIVETVFTLTIGGLGGQGIDKL